MNSHLFEALLTARNALMLQNTFAGALYKRLARLYSYPAITAKSLRIKSMYKNLIADSIRANMTSLIIGLANTLFEKPKKGSLIKHVEFNQLEKDVSGVFHKSIQTVVLNIDIVDNLEEWLYAAFLNLKDNHQDGISGSILEEYAAQNPNKIDKVVNSIVQSINHEFTHGVQRKRDASFNKRDVRTRSQYNNPYVTASGAERRKEDNNRKDKARKILKDPNHADYDKVYRGSLDEISAFAADAARGIVNSIGKYPSIRSSLEELQSFYSALKNKIPQIADMSPNGFSTQDENITHYLELAKSTDPADQQVVRRFGKLVYQNLTNILNHLQEMIKEKTPIDKNSKKSLLLKQN